VLYQHPLFLLKELSGVAYAVEPKFPDGKSIRQKLAFNH
jgi:hypothetical protein